MTYHEALRDEMSHQSIEDLKRDYRVYLTRTTIEFTNKEELIDYILNRMDMEEDNWRRE